MKRPHHPVKTFALAAGALFLPPPLLSDPGDPIGSNFVVNTTTTGIQVDPRVAVDADGDFVVVWAGGAGGSFECNHNCSIYGQRFDSDGVPVGTEFQIPSTITGRDEEHAAVAMDEAGDFVVVWDRYEPSGDGTADGVFGRRFDADGSALGDEFRISTASTTLENFDPSVASNAAGDFVVTWMTDESETGDFIFAARYASDGTPQGGAITVNTPAALNGIASPSAAVDEAGGFVVAWFQRNLIAPYHVLVRRYDEDGIALGDEVQVDASTTDVRPGSLAMDGEGDFVVTWSTPDVASNVFFQRFDADGTAVGTPTQANALEGGERPSVAMHPGGAFAITFARLQNVGDDADIWTRLFEADGTPIGNEQQTSTAVSAEQSDAYVALGPDGQLVVAWQGPDADESGILAQRIETPDLTPPSATIAISDADLEFGDSTTVTITFSEAPVGFTLDDLAAENATLSALVSVSATEFTAMLTAGTTEDATNVVTLAAGSYEDAAGNQGTLSTSNNYTIEDDDGGGGGGSFDRITLLGLLTAAGLAALTRRWRHRRFGPR